MLDLIKFAEKNRILVREYDLGDELLGVYIKTTHMRFPCIVLHSKLSFTSPEARVVLAEEIGHCFTTIGVAIQYHNNYGKMVQVNKIEKAALRYAGNLIMPDKELHYELRHGQPSIYELANIFNVTEEFVKIRLQIFKEEEYALRHGTLYQRIKTTAYLMGGFSCLCGTIGMFTRYSII